MGRRVATIIVGLFLLSVAAIPGGAEASSADRGEADLSSLPGIEAYLNSIGVDPGAVVVQQGRFNYAGANCPGAEWNCTSATKVVQISTATSGANIFDCLPALNALIPALNECLIVQSSVSDPLETASSMNSANCNADLDDSPGKSKCTVRQQSKKGKNNAVVHQNITQRSHSPQTATEYAEISQTSDTGSNTARITQTIDQSLQTGTPDDPTQQQQARQTAKITQNSVSGNNSADLQQTMLQVESAQSNADITQEQNQNTDSPGPNQDASIAQSSNSGNNWANLAGQLTQRQSASCGSCSVTQREGIAGGGQKGKVDQSTLTGTSNQGTGKQVEDQRQDATTTGTLTQTKVGPQDCCLTQVGGGAANVNTVTQVNIHVDNEALGSTGTTMQTGQCTAATGQECTVDQTYTANGVEHQNTETGPSVTHIRTCGEGGEGGNFCSDDVEID